MTGRAPIDSARDLRPRTALWWLVGLTAAGAALRFYGLDSSLWYDEIRTVVDSVRQPLLTIVTHFPGNNDHLFYSVLAHLSMWAFGDESWAFRLPAALFGVAAIPMLYLLGVQVASRLEGVAAAGLLAVSYHTIWYAQNARGYTLLLFTTILATHALLIAHREDSRRMYVLYAVVAAVGAWTHLTMVLVVLSHAAVVLAALIYEHLKKPSPARWINPILGFALSGMLTIALYSPVLMDLQSFFGAGSSNSSVATVGWAIREAIEQLAVGFGAGAIVLAAVLVGLVGCWSYLRRNPMALALFIVPGPVMLITALVLDRPVFPRFFFFLAGFALLIGVRGAVACAGWASRALSARLHPIHLQTAAAAVVVAGMAAASAWVLPYSYRVPKQDYDGALQYVQSVSRNGDAVVLVGSGTVYPYRNYFDKPWPQVADAAELEALTGGEQTVWLLYTFPSYIEILQPELAAAIRRQCSVSRSFPGTVSGGAIVVNECRRG